MKGEITYENCSNKKPESSFGSAETYFRDKKRKAVKKSGALCTLFS